MEGRACLSSYNWFHVTGGANIGDVIMAAVSALPGFVDWAMGIPQGSPAKRHGLQYMMLNVAALVLFIVNAVIHVNQWTAVHLDKF